MIVIDRFVRAKDTEFEKVTFEIDTVSPSEASMMADHAKFDIEHLLGFHEGNRPYGILMSDVLSIRSSVPVRGE